MNGEHNPSRHDATQNNHDDLIPLEWDEAIDEHIELMEENDTPNVVLQSRRYRLRRFVGWLTDEKCSPGIEKSIELRPEHLQDYKNERSNEVKKTTVKTEMDTIRIFLRSLEKYGALPSGMHEHAEYPDFGGGRA